MLIYLAGLRNILADVLEAADRWAVHCHGCSRDLAHALSVILFSIMAIIGSHQVFTQAFVMTGGGRAMTPAFMCFATKHSTGTKWDTARLWRGSCWSWCCC